jgi:TonB family protein
MRLLRLIALGVSLAGLGFAAEKPPLGPRGTYNGQLVDGLPLIDTYVPAAFPANAPADVKQGTATVRLIVDDKGAITSAKIMHASDPVFGEAALAAVKQWTFSPGVEDGKYATMSIDVPFEFSRDRPVRPGLLPSQRLLPRPVPRTDGSLIDAPLGDSPAALQGRGVPGIIAFQCLVDAEGKASDLHITHASHVEYVVPAIATFPQWRFSPAKRGELPVKSEFSGEVTYEDAHPLSRTDVLKANGLSFPAGAEVAAIPVPMNVTDPVWPYERLLKGEGGSASVEITIAPNGVVSDVRVLDATQPEFGEALAAAMTTWTFAPAIVGGRGVEVTLIKHAEFTPPAAEASDADPLARLVGLARKNPIPGGAGLDAKLVPLYRVRPNVPLDSASDEKGVAVIEFVVDRDGRVRLPRIVSATRPALGWSAATALNQWVFTVPMRGGKPTDVKFQIPIEF